MKMVVVVLILLVSAVLPSVSGNIGVPVILWGEKGSLDDIPKPLAGHTISSEDFTAQLNSIKPPQITIVFQQDELSAEDFLKFGSNMDERGAFKNMRNFMAEKESVYLPSVKSPVHSLDALKKLYNDVIEVSDMDKSLTYLRSVKLQPSTLCIVKLADTANDEDIRTAISENDDFIGKVMQHVRDTGLTYVGAFTGKQHRKIKEIVMQGTGRHLLATEESNTTQILNSTCFIVYVDKIEYNNATWNTKDFVITDESADKTNCTGDLFATFKNKESSFTMSVKKVLHYWVVYRVAYEQVVGGDNGTTLMNLNDNHAITAPMEMSFSCGENIQFTDNKTDPEAVTTRVSFGRLQLQAYKHTKMGVFDDPYDCTGFFTLPIWTVLFTSFFLLLITISGLVMLSNITAFDRLDDPKGRQLVINVSE